MSLAGAAAIAADTAIIAGGVLGGMGKYNEGKEGRRQAYFQASEALKQADLEKSRSIIAQQQGEQEEARRMRAYSKEVGSIYAAAAGNGMLIDSGSAGDTLGRMLDTSSKFAAQDVSTIHDNTKLTMWTHEANRKQLLRSAENYIKTGKAKYKAGILGATVEGIKTVGSLGLGYAMGGGFSGGAGTSKAPGIDLNKSGSWMGGGSALSSPTTMIA
jgi:hypothetical protein